MEKYTFNLEGHTLSINAVSEEAAAQYFDECRFEVADNQRVLIVPDSSAEAVLEAVSDESTENQAPAQGPKKMTDEATKCLINLVKDNSDEFKSKLIKQKSVWRKVEMDFLKRGFVYSANQCENRYKSLKRSYTEHMMIVKKSGSGKPRRFKPSEEKSENHESHSRKSQN